MPVGMGSAGIAVISSRRWQMQFDEVKAEDAKRPFCLIPAARLGAVDPLHS
jgi:hypothetical protein